MQKHDDWVIKSLWYYTTDMVIGRTTLWIENDQHSYDSHVDYFKNVVVSFWTMACPMLKNIAELFKNNDDLGIFLHEYCGINVDYTVSLFHWVINCRFFAIAHFPSKFTFSSAII